MPLVAFMGLILFGLVFLIITVIPVDGKAPFNPNHGIPQLVAARSPHAPLNARSDDLTIYTFDQFIDHDNPSLGTFKQRYWLNAEYYEAGGPIVLFTPGENDATGYTGYIFNSTLSGTIAQKLDGAAVMLEHRFFGESNPYPNATTQSLRVLTIQQAINDLVYFAKTVDLTMKNGDQFKPHMVPWILVGGSYSGALTSFTMVDKPGVFFAGYASSAVVEVTLNFWQYFTPILQHMPKNCSADVEAVVAYLDGLYAANDISKMQTLKETFNLGKLQIDDFAWALQKNLLTWQDLTPSTGVGSAFYTFCDALEVENGVSASANGWGLDHAISAWGKYWNETYYAIACGVLDPLSCFDTHNSSDPYWHDYTLPNSTRTYQWLLCNELGFYWGGPPPGQPAIVSRILQPHYWERTCQLYFPEKFHSLTSPSIAATNAKYKGWNVDVKRLFFSNGYRDPWLDVTVSAEGLNKANTSMQPIYMSDGFHTTDLIMDSGKIDQAVAVVQRAGLEYMKLWVSQWPNW